MTAIEGKLSFNVIKSLYGFIHANSPARLYVTVGWGVGQTAGCSAAAFPGNRQESGYQQAKTSVYSGPENQITHTYANKSLARDKISSVLIKEGIRLIIDAWWLFIWDVRLVWEQCVCVCVLVLNKIAWLHKDVLKPEH